MAKKLTYFDLNGLAEGIRYILHYTGQKFEDHRLDFKSWPVKDVKDRLPYGQLPLYQEGERVLHQSLAIAKYVAAKTPLIPSDPWEQAILDATVLTLYDYHKLAVAIFSEKDPKKKENLMKTFFEEQLDFYFSRFEKQLKEKGYHGGKLSWVDFIFVGIIETSNMFFKRNVEKNYPAISELMNTIVNLPGVKEYIKTRKEYTV